ncbi:hypothetical protein CGLO_14342 [Colletotrichum gloeosporioides Cg-14]|uniref:Uncharacterized protein n=1 Tax=Colletotrichum gloeosporioides (strain Cg-14) TaxID=1237896 RepID=T0K452_COLGC|nr:hypothetical protein CGLO_14342 [Colletotrichum gloeosporioides Cg-14]
MTTGVAVALIT